MADTRGREIFGKYKKYLNIGVTICCRLFSQKKRKKLLEKYRYKPGKLGIGIRYILLKSLAKECGDNVSIFQGVFLLNPENACFGNNVSIQPMCYIECGLDEIGLIVGNDVSIGHGTTIMATSHVFDGPGVIKNMGLDKKTVQIKDNVWIGAKVTVLYGVTIEEGCVVGAGSLINKSTKKDGVYVGTPARLIRERKIQ